MSLVLDPSLALSWYFEDERTSLADAILDRVATWGAVVPTLWRLEIANGFQMAIRRKRIAPAYRDEALSQLMTLPISTDQETDVFAWTRTLSLSDRYKLTAYDAAYLELAQRRRLPLASLDRQLQSAAKAAGIGVAALEA